MRLLVFIIDAIIVLGLLYLGYFIYQLGKQKGGRKK